VPVLRQPTRALFCAPIVLALAASPAFAELEQEVKAAYLFKFLTYVEWPQTALGDGAPLVIGVLGDDDVYACLTKIVGGREAQGRAVEVRRLAVGQAPAGVHLLFVGRSAAVQLRRLGHPVGVAVVSDTAGALERGAMINFLRVGDNVRFEVAPEVAEVGGLHISSRMLAVAERVKVGPS
jgi:YfiR/HmsC-like